MWAWCVYFDVMLIRFIGFSLLGFFKKIVGFKASPNQTTRTDGGQSSVGSFDKSNKSNKTSNFPSFIKQKTSIITNNTNSRSNGGGSATNKVDFLDEVSADYSEHRRIESFKLALKICIAVGILGSGVLGGMSFYHHKQNVAMIQEGRLVLDANEQINALVADKELKFEEAIKRVSPILANAKFGFREYMLGGLYAHYHKYDLAVKSFRAGLGKQTPKFLRAMIQTCLLQLELNNPGSISSQEFEQFAAEASKVKQFAAYVELIRYAKLCQQKEYDMAIKGFASFAHKNASSFVRAIALELENGARVMRSSKSSQVED